MIRNVKLLAPLCLLSVAALSGQTKRPLAIEDYYRLLSIVNPQIAGDGKTVRFSVQTRVESDNSSKTEVFTVPTDGSSAPLKIAEEAAQDGRGRGRGASRAVSP